MTLICFLLLLTSCSVAPRVVAKAGPVIKPIAVLFPTDMEQHDAADGSDARLTHMWVIGRF